MCLENPEISRAVQPGQFVNLRVRDEAVPLLRRPFSVCRTNRDEGTFDLLWKIYGTGTELMSKARPGDRFNVLGPLGNGFSISSSTKNAIVIAGGLGVAPMPLLIERLKEKRTHVKAQLGARRSDELWGEEIFQSLGAQVSCATDDGSRGHKGFVTSLLQEELKKNQEVEVFACGPMPMLAKVSQICLEAKVSAQLSVETMMGCGFGICMGCPMTPAGGVKNFGRYLLACVDGPVFSANAVQFAE
jgi:dihydroorotate dehydrogenase electron transfer subunit